MKSEGAVKYKLKQVRYRLKQKAIRNGLSKKPCNCTHSGLVRGSASDALFYVCLLDSDKPREWDGTICDPSVPNTCPFFKPWRTKESISSEIDGLIQGGEIGKIAAAFPDLAALLWVLGEDIDAGDSETEEQESGTSDGGERPSPVRPPSSGES